MIGSRSLSTTAIVTFSDILKSVQEPNGNQIFHPFKTMSLEIINGTTSKPIASAKLIEALRASDFNEGNLYVGYPVIATHNGSFLIDALLVTKDKGIVVFDLIESQDGISGYPVRQDEAVNKITARFLLHQDLMHKRDLAVTINPISFCPATFNRTASNDPNYVLATPETLQPFLRALGAAFESDDIYRTTLSVLQHITSIRQPTTPRIAFNTNSRGSKLRHVEQSIATLDMMQSKAVIETVEGVQRIRGLAGSGKTIVLALKAAYLHSQHPDWKIAVTFYTRSLKHFYENLITKFVVEQSGAEPNWNKINILSSWGAPGGYHRDGLYHIFCSTNSIDYYDYRSAVNRFSTNQPFGAICKEAITEAPVPRDVYDAILIDEAQDLPAPFLQLCHLLLREPKRLVYAYDELQNLSNQSTPPPEEIFGQDSDGIPNVSFQRSTPETAQQDIILEVCYRNSRTILTTAHALGFGIYRQPPQGEGTGLIQMFDDSRLWREVGYMIDAGPLSPGIHVKLSRTPKTSPPLLESHSNISDLISFHNFRNQEDQSSWLADQIQTNLLQDELSYNDILVVNPDPRTTRTNVRLLRKLLLDKGIQSHIAGVDTPSDVFMLPSRDSITITGIHRAKGNEAAMVYVINAQDSNIGNLNLARKRNQLFTAITRSKAWVRVSGLGSSMNRLVSEFKGLESNDFKLSFVYPTPEELEHLRVVHRHVSQQRIQKTEGGDRNLSELLRDIESGEISPRDLNSELLDRLRQAIG